MANGARFRRARICLYASVGGCVAVHDEFKRRNGGGSTFVISRPPRASVRAPWRVHRRRKNTKHFLRCFRLFLNLRKCTKGKNQRSVALLRQSARNRVRKIVETSMLRCVKRRKRKKKKEEKIFPHPHLSPTFCVSFMLQIDKLQSWKETVVI